MDKVAADNAAVEWVYDAVHTTARISTGKKVRDKKGRVVDEWRPIRHRRLFLIASNWPISAPHSHLLRIVQTTRKTRVKCDLCEWDGRDGCSDCTEQQFTRYSLSERKRMVDQWTRQPFLSPVWTRIREVSGRPTESMERSECLAWLTELIGERRANAAMEALQHGEPLGREAGEELLSRYGGD